MHAWSKLTVLWQSSANISVNEGMVNLVTYIIRESEAQGNLNNPTQFRPDYDRMSSKLLIYVHK